MYAHSPAKFGVERWRNGGDITNPNSDPNPNPKIRVFAITSEPLGVGR